MSDRLALANALDDLFAPGTSAAEVLAFFRAQLVPTHLVGGCVRDLLLGRPTNDVDVVVPSGGLVMARRLADAVGGAYVPLDVDRDAARAVFKDRAGRQFYVDCAGWRADTLAGDLAQRDFTINALALDLQDPTVPVVDVTGGLGDLKRRLVRVAAPTSLPDDPLRGLRAVRLLAELSPYEFRLEGETVHALRRYAHLLAVMSAERVRDELVRILASDRPGNWLRLMLELDQLAIVLPEAAALVGVSQSRPHHWDVFEHTAHVLDYLAWQQAWLLGQADLPEWPQRAFDQVLGRFREALSIHFSLGESVARSRRQMVPWAGLCHDWGKPATRTVEAAADGMARTRFLGHEAVSAEMASEALRRLRFNDAEVRRVALIVALHLRPVHLAPVDQEPSRRSVYRFFRDAGDAGVDVAMLSLADHQATHGPDLEPGRWHWRLSLVFRLLDDYFTRREIRVTPEPLVDGNELMAALELGPGRLVGRLLSEIAEAQVAGEISTKDEALAWAAQTLRDAED